MDFETEEGFTGLYGSESGRRSNESDYSDGDHEKPSKKDLLIGRRKDKKESKKDKGYAALAGESSPEEDAETKSPSKSKKTKAFKFPSKSKEKREKSRDKEKVGEKEVKEKELLEREKKKEKLRKEKEKREKEKEEKIKVKELKEKGKDKDKEKVKEKEKEKVKDKDKDKVKEKEKDKVKEKDKDKKDKKANKTQPTIATGIPFEEIFTLGVAQPIFGVSLGLAVERSRCHDDTNLPLVVRDCIDYLQENGLHSEAIYRIEPAKQRVLTLRNLYNDREPVSGVDYEVPTACALLKLFITELPEPVLTTELCSQFEDSSTLPAANLIPLVAQLPSCHRALLSWLMTHLACVLANEKTNRLNVQTIGTLLGPTLNMSPNLLILLIYNSKMLFPDVKLSKYVPPLTSQAPKLPETTDEITKELRKQESLLSQIHAEMHAGFVNKRREEQLWEGQRIVTQLKRKLRSVQKSTDPSCSSQNHSSLDERQMTQDEDHNEKPSSSEASSAVLQSSSEEKLQVPKMEKTVTVVVEPKVITFPVEKLESNLETKASFPIESFEDNFENYEEITKPPTPKNEMTESVYSINSETFVTKTEKPKLSDEELQLMRLQLEHAEYLHLKSILQAKINSERFEIVKLRSHIAIKNKQENSIAIGNMRDSNLGLIYSEAENEERQRLMKENAQLEQKRISLANHIFQERTACIELRIQLAMNEIL